MSFNVKVDWEAPTQNTNGSPIGDINTALTGYRIEHYSGDSSVLSTRLISRGDILSSTFTDLALLTFGVRVVALGRDGTESSPTPWKLVTPPVVLTPESPGNVTVTIQ